MTSGGHATRPAKKTRISLWNSSSTRSHYSVLTQRLSQLERTSWRTLESFVNGVQLQGIATKFQRPFLTEEDLERPNRRLVLVGGGCQTPLAAEDKLWESDTQFSIPRQTGVTFVYMTTNDSDAENPHRSGTWSHRSPRRRLRLIGTQSTHVDPSAVESSRGGHRFAGVSDESEVKGRICQHQTRRVFTGFQMRKVRTFVSQWRRPNQLGWISEADHRFGRSRVWTL